MVTPSRCPSASCSLPMSHADRGISDTHCGVWGTDCGTSDTDCGISDTSHGILDAGHGVQPGHWPFTHCNVNRGGSAPGMVRLLKPCLKGHRGLNVVKIHISSLIKSLFHKINSNVLLCYSAKGNRQKPGSKQSSPEFTLISALIYVCNYLPSLLF